MIRTSAVACLLAAFVVGPGGCASYANQQGELPMAYLQQAQQAVAVRNADKAISDLDAAESAWLGANYPYGNPTELVTDPEALRDIARARQAVQMQLWGDAAYYVTTAMTHPSAIQPLHPFWE